MSPTIRDPWQTAAPRVLALERTAWENLVQVAAPSALAYAGLTTTCIGSSLALRCRLGGPLLNRAFDAPADAASLRALRSHYDEAQVPLYFIEVDGPREVAEDAAHAAGLVRYRRAQLQLVRSTQRPPAFATDFDIGLARADEMLAAATIFCAAFDIDRIVAPVFASLFGAPRWRTVVARSAGHPVAVGLLYVAGDHGCLMGGATAPAFRNMGAQATLIGLRVALAAQLGCRLVCVRTGEPVRGDPQHSERNLVRAGFQPIGQSDSYSPPGIVWTHGRRSVTS